MEALTREAQVVLIILGFIIVVVVLIALIKNKGELKVKNVSLSFKAKGGKDNRMQMIGAYLDHTLPDLRQTFYLGYLKLLKTAGCPEDILNDTDDAQFVDEMLGNIVWSGNGINSIKSVVEKLLIDGTFLSMNYDELISVILQDIELNAKKYVNSNYKTQIICAGVDGSRKRLVSNTVWAVSLRDTVTEMRPAISKMMTYARSLYNESKN